MPKRKFKLNFLLILLIFGLILPAFGLAQTPMEMPQTPEEAKEFGLKILKELPAVTKKIWQEEAWPIMKNTVLTIIGWFRPYIEPVWDRLLDLLGKEIEKRRPELEREFQKEKEEMQKDLWQRFKELWK